MQKLKRRNTYIPMDASLVYGSMAVKLNKGQSPSAYGLKTRFNGLEVNLAQHTERSIKPLVYVPTIPAFMLG